MAALLGAAAAVLPAIAGSETSPAITAENYGIEEHRWSPDTATVGPGGVVTISNPTAVKHGVEWVSGPETPGCSKGVPVGTNASVAGTKWSGTCTFSKPGTYVFYCTVHGPEMTGTITVAASGTTTTTMTMGSTYTSSTGPGTSTSSGPGSQTQTPTGPVGPSVLGSLLVGSASSALRLAATQHGQSVHGSLDVSQAASGGRLEVKLLATRASLASVGHQHRVQVGRVVRPSLRAGRVTFAVALDAKARHALRVRRHLALAVEIVLTATHGAVVTISRNVVLRG